MTRKEKSALHDQRLKRMWDAYSVRETAKMEGREEGLLEGREEGRLEGMEKGKLLWKEECRLKEIEEGRLEGKKEEAEKNYKDKLIIAKNLIGLGFSIDKIMEITGCSREDIQGVN